MFVYLILIYFWNYLLMKFSRIAVVCVSECSYLLSSLWASVPLWYQVLNSLWFHLVLLLRKIEKLRKVAPIWQLCIRVSQLIKVWVFQTAKRSWSGLWIVLQ